MTRFLTGLGWLAAIGLAVISTGANFRFGTLLTSTDERWLYGAIFAFLDVLKIVLPIVAADAFTEGKLRKGRASLGIFLLLSVLSFTASIGLYATTKSETVGDAMAAHTRYKDAKAAKDKADAELTAFGQVRALGEIEGDLGPLKRDPLYDRSKQCTDATAPESRTLCAQVDRLNGERDKAIEYGRLRQATADAALALGRTDVVAAMRSVDPQAEALGRLVQAEPETVRATLALLIALLIELGSGMGPWLMSSATSRPKAAQAAPPSVSPGSVMHIAKSEPAAPAAHLDVAQWASEALVKRKGSYVPTSEVFADYQSHCERVGALAMTANAFARAMTKAGFERVKRGGTFRYLSVALMSGRPVGPRIAVSNPRRAPQAGSRLLAETLAG